MFSFHNICFSFIPFLKFYCILFSMFDLIFSSLLSLSLSPTGVRFSLSRPRDVSSVSSKRERDEEEEDPMLRLVSDETERETQRGKETDRETESFFSTSEELAALLSPSLSVSVSPQRRTSFGVVSSLSLSVPLSSVSVSATKKDRETQRETEKKDRETQREMRTLVFACCNCAETCC